MAVTTVLGSYTQHGAASDVTAGVQCIRKIIWHGYTTNSHTLQVKDSAGIIKIPAIACGANGGAPIELDFSGNPLILNGIETDILGSGTAVYLYA